jgi:hypothetical protein
MTLEEGIQLAKMCIAEIQKRLIVNLPNITVKCIDAKGVTLIKLT